MSAEVFFHRAIVGEMFEGNSPNRRIGAQLLDRRVILLQGRLFRLLLRRRIFRHQLDVALDSFRARHQCFLLLHFQIAHLRSLKNRAISIGIWLKAASSFQN